MNALSKPAMSWSSDLGLLPIPFLPNDDRRFLLVNGLTGNFCLDQTEDRDRDEKRGGAWSSNVGHYVSLLGERVEVLRYDASASVAETYSLESVQKNLGTFHAYLESSQPRAGMSVISHAIRVFRQSAECLSGRGWGKVVAHIPDTHRVRGRQMRPRSAGRPEMGSAEQFPGQPGSCEPARLGGSFLRVDKWTSFRQFDPSARASVAARGGATVPRGPLRGISNSPASPSGLPSTIKGPHEDQPRYRNPLHPAVAGENGCRAVPAAP